MSFWIGIAIFVVGTVLDKNEEGGVHALWDGDNSLFVS